MAVLLGSVLPDVPFSALTLLYTAYYGWVSAPPAGQPLHEYLHFDLYFNDPIWQIGTSLLHAPFLIAIWLGIGWWALRRQQKWGVILFWFAVGAGFHALIDILTHHSDGPLLLFPFNWHYRFPSPISYWEPDYYGRLFFRLEHVLDVALLAYLGVVWWQDRRMKSTQ